MIFTEARFLPFMAVVWIVHWILDDARLRKAWLLAASCLFYGVCGLGFLGLMLATALVDYGAGRLIGATESPRRRRWIIVGSLVSNLGVLGTFKYAGFFADSVRAGLARLGLELAPTTLAIALPVGISFYTFQSLSYTIDVYRGTLQPVRSALDFLFFVCFFPQLVAGPIVRAGDFLPQTASKKTLAEVRFRACLVLFLVGFVKKACVADHVAHAVDQVFSNPAGHTTSSLWLADALYALQIYCDFSGYSDMAIALAGLFGYRLTRNFDFPYLACSVTEFWRRWHISLSTWFRDYLYVPLGGNRAGPGKTARNLIVVFFLCGLWHGASWTFVVWGLVHGIALLVERTGLGARLARWPRSVGWAWTTLVVLLAWVLFRSRDFRTASAYFGGLLGGSTGTLVLPPAWWALIGLFLALHLAASREALIPRFVWRLPRWAFALAFGGTVALFLPWVAVGYAPFIYFQF
jgi:alginate O-acetyltransferase complex protein AlgI